MTLFKIIKICLKIAVLEWDLAVLYHKSSHTIERLELIIVESKSDYDLFTKSFAKNDACLLYYTSHTAELIAKLIHKYNNITVNNLLNNIWYVNSAEIEALVINLEQIKKDFKNLWEN